MVGTFVGALDGAFVGDLVAAFVGVGMLVGTRVADATQLIWS